MSENVSMEELNSLLEEFFGGDRELIEQWITTNIPILGGHQPNQLFNSSEGRSRIIQILGEMKYGETA